MRISDWSSDVCSSDLEQGDGTTQNYQLSWGNGGDGPLQIVVGGNYVKQDPINAVDRAISRFPAPYATRCTAGGCSGFLPHLRYSIPRLGPSPVATTSHDRRV